MPPATDKSAPGSAAEHDALPPGTRFGELEILRILGVGGFGMVYLARDHALERDVALKEYMPASLASRGEGAHVSVRSGGFAETYAVGLRSFVNEARLLAKFDHPSLVKVYRFWEANGTAYMVMPYLQGRTLRDARKAMGGKAPDEPWLRNVLDPILGALEVLHREGVYHRDIAPDNIWLQDDGPAILLDFGAARRVISDRTQSLTAILKPSYAPIEQYAEMSALRQGPWTDIYALGAVTHFLLAGAPPGPSTARALQDDMVPLWMRHYPGVSPRFLAAVDWALQVRPKERPQSVDELRAALDGRIEPPASERHDKVHTASAPPLAEPTTDFEPTRRVAGPGVATTFEPTMRVAPPRPTQTQAQARPTAAAVAPVAPTVVPTAAAAAVTARSGSTVAAPPVTVAKPAAARPAPAPLTPARAAPAPATAGMATGTKLLIAAAAVVLGLAAGAAVRYFGLFGGAAAAPVGLAPSEEPQVAAAPVVAPVAPPVAVPGEAAVPAASTAVAPPPPEAPPVVAAVPETRAPAAPPRDKPLVAAAAPAESARPAAPPEKPPPEAALAPAVVARAAPAATAAPPAVPVAAAPAGPQTAREACGKRVLFALANCMERECQDPRFAAGADCVQLREQRRAREVQ